MSIRDVLRFDYDRVTNFWQIRLGLYEYGKIQLRYTKMYWEYDTNRLRIHRKHLRIMYE